MIIVVLIRCGIKVAVVFVWALVELIMVEGNVVVAVDLVNGSLVVIIVVLIRCGFKAVVIFVWAVVELTMVEGNIVVGVNVINGI